MRESKRAPDPRRGGSMLPPTAFSIFSEPAPPAPRPGYGVTDGPLTIVPTSFDSPTKKSISMQAMPIADTRS